MSKPQYLRHSDSPAKIVITVEALLKYIFTITNNEKQFPKAYRYTLVSDLRNTCLNLHKAIYRAMAIKPRHQAQLKRRIKFQNKAYYHIVDLKALLVVAFGIVQISNKEHVSMLLAEVVEAYNRWIKNDKRMFQNLPTEIEYIKFKQDLNKKRRRISEINKALTEMDHDKAGYAIFVRR